jgi:polyhydroxybutyrate depolymerase
VLSSGDLNRSVTVGTTSRTYVLHVPAAYRGSDPVPLVVDFHGLGSSGSGELSGSTYKTLIDSEGVISAYPDGVQGPSGTAWNMGSCCVPGVDDVAFAKALVQDVETVACIDPKRVYAIGFSIGGGMAHYIGCHAADVFAAVSPAAADLLGENEAQCAPARPLTVFFFRGTNDSAVPYDGGSMTSSGMTLTFLGAKATFERWAELDECTGTPSAADSNGCSTYSTCGAGVEVTLCTKQGGGHEAGDASIAWPVLKKYTLP